MMKNLFFKLNSFALLSVLSFWGAANAQYSLDWGHTYETRNPAYCEVIGVGYDAAGNYYVAGQFAYDTLDLDFGAGVTELVPSSQVSVFIAKYTTDGNLVWGKSIGDEDNDVRLYDLKVDEAGNIYAVGTFKTSPVHNVDFDPGPSVHDLSTGVYNSAYVLKWNTNGNFEWVKDIITNTSTIGVQGKTVDLDQAGNVYVAGNWRGDINFGLPNNFGMNSIGTDAFIAKYSNDGNWEWAKQFSTAQAGETCIMNKMTYSNDHLYFTGYFNGNVDFNAASGVDTLNSTISNDMFVTKLDTGGNYVWAKQIVDGGWDYGNDVAVDLVGNVYTVGGFEGTVDFNPGAGIENATAAGWDLFVQKLDANGNFVWVRTIGGGALNDDASSIAIDQANRILVACSYEGTVDLDPGAGIDSHTAVGGIDAFILQLDAAGNYLGVHNYGGTSYDFAECLAVDLNGDVVVGGRSGTETVDFDRGGGPTYGHVLRLTSPTSSIDDATNATNIQVYPNPTAYEVTITNLEEGNTIKIINVHGQVILNQQIMNEMVNIPVVDLANGMYIIQIENNETTIQKKLIIKK